MSSQSGLHIEIMSQKKKKSQVVAVAHVCNPATQEAEFGRS
jgi:hypothetical protein